MTGALSDRPVEFCNLYIRHDSLLTIRLCDDLFAHQIRFPGIMG